MMSDPAQVRARVSEKIPADPLAWLVPDLDDIPEQPDGDIPELPDADELPGASWGRVDLADTVAGVLAGTIERPAPSVGRLDDGRALFYRGRVNGIAGASGSGKTWTALVACAQELAAGQSVAFIDLEDDAAGIVARLLDLGADPAAIVARFVYVQPGEGYGPAARERIGAVLDELRPTVAVVDSTGEAMALDGAKPNDDDDTARWFRKLPRWLARRTGAAVIVLDHVVKTDEGGLWPIGSQRKRAAISGAQYMQLTVRAFDKATPGRAKLVCAKDRAGNYRAGQRVADLDAEPGRAPLLALTAPPEAPQGSGGDWRPTALMERISTTLAAADEALSFRGINERVSGKTEHVRLALDELVRTGHVSVEEGPRRSQLHTFVRRYEQRADPRSDLYRPPSDDARPGNSQPFPGSVTVSVPLKGETENTHLTVTGKQSGNSGKQSPNGAPVDLDDRPTCPVCTRRLGKAEAAAGMCLPCQRIAARTGVSR